MRRPSQFVAGLALAGGLILIAVLGARVRTENGPAPAQPSRTVLSIEASQGGDPSSGKGPAGEAPAGVQAHGWAQIIDPDRFAYGPEFFDEVEGRPVFDAERFLLGQSSSLMRELPLQLADTDMSINEAFDDLCSEYGVSPKVLLVLMEMRTHLVRGERDHVAASIGNPFAAPDGTPRGFLVQSRWAADTLSRLYLHALEEYDLYPDVASRSVPRHLDPANYALYSFAELLGWDVSRFESRADFARFIETYSELFEDPRLPLSPAQQALLPRPAQRVVRQSNPPDATAPPFSSPVKADDGSDRLLSPFRDSEIFPYSQANRHRGVDIVNPAITVTAVYSGIAYRYGDCAVTIEHDELPAVYEKYVPVRNVRTYYTHLEPGSRVEGGTRVSRGEVIGVIDVGGACMQGDPHVHVSVRPRGQGETTNAIDPSPYLGAVLSCDRGARSGYPDLSDIDYVDSLDVSTPRVLTFETSQEVLAWRIRLDTLDGPSTGSIVPGGISGQSGRIRGDPGRRWNDGLTFHLVDFEGGASYRIVLDVRLLGSADAYPPYLLVRSASGSCADKGIAALDAGTGETVRRSVEITLDDCDDYYLLLGERYAGEYLVDNIVVEPVTTPLSGG